ncbi:uncharacterized protein LOC106175072 isoform X2 [Lingula anatina]|uniref:Uncharacterized protein LOC106175072 isoform X2 n=1 Tax=Lingula anatina TaxID=7574 RepID=A0A1S3JQV2_LINAN|nr:uncharacterized protein LOC106175072 isoform X2 [Lingula anatina]|eukprot:XP_013412349.1 uncharacterized protein LOC106175072 isoform X2 [Lingula anatina]
MTTCSGTRLRPHPADCNKFLQCRNGISVESSCASGLVFNPKTQACDWGYNYECKSTAEASPQPQTTVNYRATTKSWKSKSIAHSTEEADIFKAHGMSSGEGVNGGVFGFVVSICLIVGLLLFLKRDYLKRRFFNKCFKDREKQAIRIEPQKKRLSPEDIHLHIYAELPDPSERNDMNNYTYNPIPERTSISYIGEIRGNHTTTGAAEDTYLEPSVHGSLRADSSLKSNLQNNSLYLTESGDLGRNMYAEDVNNGLNQEMYHEDEDIYSYVKEDRSSNNDNREANTTEEYSLWSKHNNQDASEKSNTGDPGYDAIEENIYDCVCEVDRRNDATENSSVHGASYLPQQNADCQTDASVSVTDLSVLSDSQPELDASVDSSDFSDFTDDDDEGFEPPYEDGFSVKLEEGSKRTT